MIIIIINQKGIKNTIIDNGLGLNICSIELLREIGVDMSLIKLYILSIHGFDNVGRQSLGTITLSVKIGPLNLPTLIHVMLDNISYNLLLGIPCFHSMGATLSTLHCTMKFVYKNKIYTVGGDPNIKKFLQDEAKDKPHI
jgi:hypothetical protein